MKEIIITGNDLTLEDFISVVRNGAKVILSVEAAKVMQESRDIVEYFVEKDIVRYGITTGFGKFSDVIISSDDTSKLQENLIISHAVGMGEPFSIEIARGIMLLRVNSIAKGKSGVRISTVQLLIDMLNADVAPVIPSQGSLGASGDLAPLSHMVLPMLGYGQVFHEGEILDAPAAFEKVGLKHIELSSKEGLGLINGTQAMTSIAALNIYDAKKLAMLSDIVAAMTLESLNGIVDAFDARVHAVRNQAGQITTAKNILALISGSSAITKQGDLRVQDPYVLRCIPQIHGASKDAINFIEGIVLNEMNAVTDNPLIFAENQDVISGGNFHGQPIALPMDYLKVALCEIANVSERRIERLVNPALSFGLPAFLVKQGGLNNGYMIVQYSAASIVSESKVLAHPASVDSIPSSANQEDHVSMGTTAARQARMILENSQKVVAMELLCAAQAIDLRGIETLGQGSKIAYDIVREEITLMENDRQIKLDLNVVEKLVTSHRIVDEVVKKVQISL